MNPEVEKLDSLRAQGVLSDIEYWNARARVDESAHHPDIPAPTRGPGRSKRWMVPLGAVIALVVAAAVILLVIQPWDEDSGKAVAKPIKVVGTVVLTDPDSTLNATLTGTHACSGAGGYNDIGKGADVVISDDSGKTLSIAHLGAGRTPTQDTGLTTDCIFKFATEVPAGQKYYGVTLTHRGTVKFSESTVAHAALQIGS